MEDMFRGNETASISDNPGELVAEVEDFLRRHPGRG
jgi:hypothetical protein